MLAGLIYLIFGVIELLIGLRFVLLLLGANASSPFVSLVYSWSGPFVAPFAGMFGQHVTIAGPGVVQQSIFDWTALIALIIVAIIGAVLARLLASVDV